jgi:hypothetical protein
MGIDEAGAAIGQFGHIITRTRSKRCPEGNFYDGYGTIRDYDRKHLEFTDNYDRIFIVRMADTTFKPMQFKDKSNGTK